MIIAAILYNSFPENTKKNCQSYGGAQRFWEGLAYGIDLLNKETGEDHELWIIAPNGEPGTYATNVLATSDTGSLHDEALFLLDQISPDFVIGHHPYCLSGQIVKEYHYVCRVIGYRKRLKKYPFLKNFVTSSLFGATHYGRKWPVIHQVCNPAEVEYREEKEDYFLFVSNLSRGFKEKGLVTAINLAKETGVHLKIAGPEGGVKGSLAKLRKLINKAKNIEYIGPISGQQKLKTISKAKALLYPIDKRCKEMGSNIVIECAWCGTPVITTDVGCMTEYYKGLGCLAGIACNNWQEYLDAIHAIDEIQPMDCREWAEKNFDWETIARQYLDLAERIVG